MSLRLYEHESKLLLQRGGIDIPTGMLLGDVDSAKEVPENLFPVAVKSQVLTGGRMKAGGIAFADDPATLRRTVERLLGMQIGGFTVERVLVEPKSAVVEEHYLGITYDPTAKAPTAIYSRAGGVDVEQAGSASTTVFPLVPAPSSFRYKELLSGAGLTGRRLTDLTRVMTSLAQIFVTNDCTLAEINPLAVTESGQVLALDAHLDLDDDALYRHGDLVGQWDLSGRDAGSHQSTEFERMAEQIDAADHRGVAGRMVAFEGSLGLLIGGGGASLTAFDAVRRHGGSPADYCEIGGNPSVWKVKELTKLIMSRDGVEKLAVIMNVVSNTRVDLVARGVIKGMIELGMDPAERVAIFRVPGAWEDDGFAILRKYRVPFVDRTVSIDEAARRALAGHGGRES